MTATVLDGKRVRDQILAELKPRVDRLRRRPGLAVVLAGHDPASEIYVRNKVKASEALGFYSEKITPPESIATEDLLGVIEGLNQRSEIDGILVQMPLPEQIDSKRILLSVAPSKDVDGFHPCNVGNLVAGNRGPRACTPAGIIELLKRYEIPIAGRHAVVIGRSDIVGKPMAILLLHENATVTICHSKTQNLAEECRRADILVAAIGKPALVTADFLKPGCTVIDVGMNRLPDGKLLGDVDREAAETIAGAFTPVPGGVGPLTIAMLMSNTIHAAEQHQCCA
ncbi:MAG: bifunctional methylenetetrahydrofolate dehydrogenase/methenyltetrahydrofolate cyclohydrolase FolD [Acidobacteriaceae bacterium]|nr:bifunctional methylenetetrahydrofolate dehydrogenase/methenyltetrahydrofolate cyclohydrolase FolD [Acidobacteriaceae bacterium]